MCVCVSERERERETPWAVALQAPLWNSLCKNIGMFLEIARGKGRRGLAVPMLPLRSLLSQTPLQSGQRFPSFSQQSAVPGPADFAERTLRVRPEGQVYSSGLLRARLFQIRQQRASRAEEPRGWMSLLGSARHTVGLCGVLNPPGRAAGATIGKAEGGWGERGGSATCSGTCADAGRWTPRPALQSVTLRRGENRDRVHCGEHTRVQRQGRRGRSNP